MTPAELLSHSDSGHLWPTDASRLADVASAYQRALQVRALRLQRGEQARGFKIGFTNRGIWDRYNVHAPIWGTVWESGLQLCEGLGRVDLEHTCQPRLEPEIAFGLRVTPPAGASLQQLFESIEWLAPAFEVVQSHLPDWKFSAADTVADGALHARLLVGRRLPLASVAPDAAALMALLAQARVSLLQNGEAVESGQGSAVLDGPLQALHHFLQELRRCPSAPDLQAGDVVTTGTWTDAWPIWPGQVWQARFDSGLGTLEIHLD